MSAAVLIAVSLILVSGSAYGGDHNGPSMDLGDIQEFLKKEEGKDVPEVVEMGPSTQPVAPELISDKSGDEDPVERDLRDAAREADVDPEELRQAILNQFEQPPSAPPAPVVTNQVTQPSQSVGVSQDSDNRNTNRNAALAKSEDDRPSFPRNRIPPRMVRAFQVLEERIRTLPNYDNRRKMWDSVENELDEKARSVRHRGLASTAENPSSPGGNGASVVPSGKSGGRSPSINEDRPVRSAIPPLVLNLDSDLNGFGESESSEESAVAPAVPAGGRTVQPLVSVLAGEPAIGPGTTEASEAVRKRPTPISEYGEASGVVVDSGSYSSADSQFSVESTERKRKLQLAMQYFQALQEARAKADTSTESDGAGETDIRGISVSRAGYSPFDLPTHFLFKSIPGVELVSKMPVTGRIVKAIRKETGMREAHAWRLYLFINTLAWMATGAAMIWLVNRLRIPFLFWMSRRREKEENQ